MEFLVGEEIHLKSGLSPVACPGCSYPVSLTSPIKPHQRKQNSVTSDISVARDDYGLGPVLMLHISFHILTSACDIVPLAQLVRDRARRIWNQWLESVHQSPSAITPSSVC